MDNLFKRILSLVLAVLMVVSYIPTSALATDGADETPADVEPYDLGEDDTPIDTGYRYVYTEGSEVYDEYVPDGLGCCDDMLLHVEHYGATCAHADQILITCNSCGMRWAQNTGNEPMWESHRYTETVNAPTCQNQGYTDYRCDGCGTGYQDTYVDPVDCSYGEDGLCIWCHTGECKHEGKCDPVEDGDYLAPTCGEDGYQTVKCQDCGKEFVKTLPATGEHSYDGTLMCPDCNQPHQCECDGDTKCTADYYDRDCCVCRLSHENCTVEESTGGDETDPEGTAVAWFYGEEYTSLQAALDAAYSGASVYLLTDIELTEPVFITKEVSIGAYEDGATATISNANGPVFVIGKQNGSGEYAGETGFTVSILDLNIEGNIGVELNAENAELYLYNCSINAETNGVAVDRINEGGTAWGSVEINESDIVAGNACIEDQGGVIFNLGANTYSGDRIFVQAGNGGNINFSNTFTADVGKSLVSYTAKNKPGTETYIGTSNNFRMGPPPSLTMAEGALHVDDTFTNDNRVFVGGLQGMLQELGYTMAYADGGGWYVVAYAAPVNVATEAELRAALESGATLINVTENIDLQNYIQVSSNVTIAGQGDVTITGASNMPVFTTGSGSAVTIVFKNLKLVSSAMAVNITGDAAVNVTFDGCTITAATNGLTLLKNTNNPTAQPPMVTVVRTTINTPNGIAILDRSGSRLNVAAQNTLNAKTAVVLAGNNALVDFGPDFTANVSETLISFTGTGNTVNMGWLTNFSANVTTTGAYLSDGYANNAIIVDYPTLREAMINAGYTFEANSEGRYVLTGFQSATKPAVAVIGSTEFASVQAAIDAAQEGDTITLMESVTLAEADFASANAGILVPAGKKITLDLKGQGIAASPAAGKAFAVIINKGNLTITDSSAEANGNLTLDLKAAGSTAYAMNTILNQGTLVIEGGYIQNFADASVASTQIGYAIDNNSTSGVAHLEIKGGNVVASGSNYYDAVRMFCNSMTNTNYVKVTGGDTGSIWMQNPSDGSAGKNTKDVLGEVYIEGGNVAVLSLEPSEGFIASVSGGTVESVSYFQTSEGRDLVNFITGGTIAEMAEGMLADGYVHNEDGTVTKYEGPTCTCEYKCEPSYSESSCEICKQGHWDSCASTASWGAHYAELLKAGGELTIPRATTLTESVTLEKNLVLDLNTFFLTGPGRDAAIIVPSGITLTIEDDSQMGNVSKIQVQSGGNLIVRNGGASVLVNDGHAVITGGNFYNMNVAPLSGNGTWSISGGLFSCDVTDKLTAGYVQLGNGIVTAKTEETPEVSYTPPVVGFTPPSDENISQETTQTVRQDIMNNTEIEVTSGLDDAKNNDQIEEFKTKNNLSENAIVEVKLEISLKDFEAKKVDENDEESAEEVTKLTFDVTPMLVFADKSEKLVVQEEVTFHLPIPSNFAAAFVDVFHYGDDNVAEKIGAALEVQGQGANRYVVVSHDEFSPIEVVAAEAPAVAEVATFDELAAAIAKGGDIKLTADITTTAAITTTGVTANIDLNGKTLTIGAGDNKFNDASNITIANGNIDITGLTVKGNAVFCLDEYEKTLVTTMTLNNVNLTGNGYSSAYGIFYIGPSSVLNVNGGVWNLKNDTFAAGGVFKADASTAILNIDGLELTAHNVRRVVTYAATTIEDSTMTITGDADGVDAEMEHGFNRSPLAITNSTITMKDMVGRGITAENGAVTITNSTVSMENVQEATIDVRKGQTVTVDDKSTVTLDKEPTITSGTINGTVAVGKKVASVNGTDYTSLAEALAAVGEGDVVIELLDDATLDYNAREAYGTAATTSITINGNDKTLTLNQKNSDWSSLGMANADGKLIFNNMTIEKVGYGDTNGAWNTHAIIVSSALEMNNVTVNQSLAVQKGAKLTNVDIVEANGYYGLWINGNGQSVEMNGGSITATNGGRGIKIADEYVDAPKSVTLNVNGTTFETAKKAAVTVSSTAGAAITATNVDITKVAADKTNFAWVDEDWSASFSKVTVNGAPAAQEAADSFKVVVTDATGAAKGYFNDLDAAVAAASAGDTVTVSEGTYAVPSVKAGITIEGDGNVLLEGCLTGTLKDLTLKNLHIKGSNAMRWGYAKGNLVFENVTFEGTGVYALHFDGTSDDATMLYKDCTIIGWVAMGGNPASCTFDSCTIKDNGKYGLIRTYFDTTIKNCTFDVDGANTEDSYQDGIHTVGADITVDNCTNVNGDMADLVNYSSGGKVVVNGVVYKAPSNSFGYTKEVDGYVRVWGEGSGNAKDSYVLKLYSGETLIATTQLNNVDNIIDGEVNVTWNFYYPTSNDKYWTTTWEEGHPNSAAQPTKVELYLDGKLATTTDVKMSGADDVAPVVWRELGGVKIVDLLGTGTAEDPYLISSLAELKFFRDSVNAGTTYSGKYVKLTESIDLATEENWTPIGNSTNKFQGHFDGGNNTVSNLKINNTESYVGFFGFTSNGSLKNLTIHNAEIVGRLGVGALAGSPYTSDVDNIKLTGKVTIDACFYVGGVVGRNAYGDLTNITVDVTPDSYVKATSLEDGIGYRTYVGGVVGFLGEGGHTVKNVTSNITVIGDIISIGGIAGIAHYGNTFENVTFTGTVKAAEGAEEVGGIAGVWYNQNGSPVTFTNVAVGSDAKVYIGTEDVTATNAYTGGAYNSEKTSEGQLTINGNVVWPVVAKIGDTTYASLQEALDAAAAGSGNVTVEILADINLTGTDWNPVTVSGPNYPMVTVEGNNKTITGLNDMLFAGTWAGKSGLIINDLTIADSTIVNDENDSKGNVGVGAFIGYPQASATITLNNCHLKDSTVNGGHWTGGLIGMAGGYNGKDGPVFMNLTITGCSVTGSTITGKGSVGGVIGHGSCAAWTKVIIENTTVSGNTITSTGSSTVKAGSVMGTIGAAGQSTTAAGETKQGGAFVSATVSGNTVTSNGTTITTIYGRQGTPTGTLEITGGAYDKYPIEANVDYAYPTEGYEIAETNGTYGLVEKKYIEVTYKDGAVEYFVNMLDAVPYKTNYDKLEGATVKLLDDIKAPGIRFMETDMVLDLNGFTYTITDATGSSGTRTSGFQIREEAANATIKNGTIAVAEFLDMGDNCDVVWMFNSYSANLVIEDVVVDCTNMAFNYDGYTYIVVGHAAADNVTLKGTTEFKNFDSTNGGAAINVAGTMTVEDTVIPGGQFELDAGASLTAPAGLDVVTVEGYKVVYENGVYTSVPVVYVAQIGEAKFETLADAFAAAQDEETITLLADIELASSVKNTKTVTLDLAGHEITGTDNNTTGNFYLINNEKGNLTITGDGIITLTATTERNWNSSSVVVANQQGNLVIDGAVIKHLGGTSMAYGIDNLTNGNIGEATTTIKAGYVDSSYFAVRQFANSTTTQNTVTVEGGDVGYMWMQSPNDKVNTATTKIKGGNVAGLCLSGVNADLTMMVAPNTTQTVYGTAPAGMVIVGSYENGFDLKKAVAQIGETSYASLAEAFAAAEAKDTITVLNDVVMGADPITVNNTVTLDLNGKTISGTCDVAQDYLFMVENAGSLTVKDSSTEQTGKIIFAQGASNVGWVIDVEGALVLESGTIELTGDSWSIGYAVDVRPNAWGTAYTNPTIFTMKGGNIVSSDGAVRVASSSADAHKNVSAAFVMEGGKINAAWDGVFIQQSNAAYDVLSFTMNGGTIESGLNPVRVYGPAPTGYVNGQNCMNIAFNGGTLTYTGTEAREWVIDGILRTGGGMTADIILDNGAITASEAFAKANVAEGYKWVETETAGVYELVEESKIQINLVSISASADAEVILDLKFRIPDEFLADEGAYATITKAGRWGDETTTLTVADLKAQGTDSSGRYVLSQGVASGEMMRDITVKFYDGEDNLIEISDYIDGSIGTEVVRSVADYARLALEKGNASQKNLVTALVTYGGYAQIFFGVDTDNPAFNILSEFGIDVPSLDGITADTITQADIKSDTNIGITHTTTSTHLDSAISMVPHFVLADGASIEDYTFTLTYIENHVTKTKTLDVVYDAANDRYDVTIEDIPSAYLDYMYKVTITKTSTGETYELTTSVMAYMKRVLAGSTNQKQLNLAKAMYLYNQAANAFFNK